MRRASLAICLAVVASVAPMFSAGCSDTGDSSAVPGDDAGPDAANGSQHDASVDSSGDAHKKSDGKVEDSAQDTTISEGGVSDTSPGDEGSDGAPKDGGGTEAGPEAGADASEDAGAADAGHDTGADSGSDAAPEAGSDAGADSPADAGLDVAPSLVPCTTAGQTGCVKCQGNNATGLCTATEAQFVQHDIETHLATAAGPDPDDPNQPTDSCYACLFENGCLDDTTFNDTGHECEDPFAGSTTTAECEDVIRCILGSGVGTAQCASVAVSGCYCGTAGVSTACQGNPAAGPINGACATQISTGLDFSLTDGTDITKNFDDTSKAGGRADQIFQCAQSNNCAGCL